MRKQKLIIRWSIVTACLIAAFWAIWYLIVGKIPVGTNVSITPSYTLPGISRWWDVLIGPVWSTIIISIIFKEQKENNDDLTFGLAFTGLVLKLFAGLALGLFAGLALGLFAGLVSGLVFGLVFGLTTGLVSGLVFGLIAGLGFISKSVFNLRFWKKMWDWLLVK